jgi:uncharacterized protein YndB with AHSA1/START domain
MPTQCHPRVFDAWADPAVKTRWFTGAPDPAADPRLRDATQHDDPATRRSGPDRRHGEPSLEDDMSSDHAQADEQQIRALLETRLAALRTKDASQFVAAFDASIVKFDLAPPLQETGSSVLDPLACSGG